MPKIKLNTDEQIYKTIRIQLIQRNYPQGHKAKRYTLGGTNQNVWIPVKHLEDDGTIKPKQNIDYAFRSAPRQLELAGYTDAIPGIKRRSASHKN